MRKIKIIFIAGLVIVLGAFGLILLSTDKPGDSKRVRLPDGTYLHIGDISFTNGSHSYNLKAVKGWRLKIARYLPGALTRQLDWTEGGGGMTINGMGLGTNLGFFTYCNGPKANGGFVFTRLEVFDEFGNVAEGGQARGTLGTINADGRTSLRIDGWGPPAFPRRGKTLGLRYYENQKGSWEKVAEFAIPNPAPGNYPTWKAEPIPATRTNGDLTISLASLQSGLSSEDESRAPKNNEVSATRAAFQIVQTGMESNSWRPIAAEIWDATGNHWKPEPYTILVQHREGVDYFSFMGALWRGEDAWKMRFELSRIGDYAPDELATFSGIAVPGAVQVITLGNTTNVAKSKLKLESITGTRAKQPGNLQWSTVEGKVNISVRVKPMPKQHRLTLVKITDETGREAKIEDGSDWNQEERVYAFTSPQGAKELNFTFALHKSRFVEFQVKPEFVRAN